MADYSLRPESLLVLGQSGSGKTTFALLYLVNRPDFVARMIFDPTGQMADRLGMPEASTVDELNLSLDDGWTIFNPHVLFPGDMAGAVDWFCGWCFWVAKTRPGRKAMLIDEVWKYCSPNSIPFTLANCIQTGRVEGLTTIFASQFPNKLNASVMAEVTELVCFKLQEKNALKTLSDLGADIDEVRDLPPGAYVSRNRESGAELRGRVF